MSFHLDVTLASASIGALKPDISSSDAVSVACKYSVRGHEVPAHLVPALIEYHHWRYTILKEQLTAYKKQKYEKDPEFREQCKRKSKMYYQNQKKRKLQKIGICEANESTNLTKIGSENVVVSC